MGNFFGDLKKWEGGDITIQMNEDSISGITGQVVSGSINVNQREAFAATGITLTLVG